MLLRIILSIGLVFALFTLTASAQETTSSATPTSSLIAPGRPNFKNTAGIKKETMQGEAKAKFQTQRAEFQKKLQTIRDERKKQIVERLDTKLSSVNTNRTERMSESLSKLSSILDKLKEKSAVLTASGKDTALVDSAIQKAQTALSTAQTAVSTQAAKEYIIQVQSETTLKNTVGVTTKQLQLDLQTTHKLVVETKQAIEQVYKELVNLRGEKRMEPGATGSAQ